MMRALGRWFDERLHLAKFARHVMNHVFPDHWSFMLGEIAFYSFIILVVTGTFLAIFFNSSTAKLPYEGSYGPLQGVEVSAAFHSVMHISFEVRAGLLIRQMHHWASLVFIGAIFVHALRIFFTAAYRRPRELNWLIGLTMLLLALANGFFGYSLPDDLLSGLGLRVGYSIVLSIPVIGPWLCFLFFGGVVPNDGTIPRLYSLHIFLMPALISVLLGLHLTIIYRQLHTNYPGKHRSNQVIVGSRLWPSYTAKSLGLFFLIFGAVAGLAAFAQIDPIWLYGPYEPAASMPGAQPDWYLQWIEGAMRLFPGVNIRFGHWLVPEVFFPAVLMPALLFAFLYVYPFLRQFFTLDTQQKNTLLLPYEQPFSTAVGCGILVFLLVLFCAGADDVLAVATDGSVVVIRSLLRILAVVAPPFTFAVVLWFCRRLRRRHSPRSIKVAVAETGSSPECRSSD